MDLSILARIASRLPPEEKAPAACFYYSRKRDRVVYTDGATAVILPTAMAKPSAGVVVHPNVLSKVEACFTPKPNLERASFRVPVSALCDWIQTDIWECPLCDGDQRCPFQRDNKHRKQSAEQKELHNLAHDQHAGILGFMFVDRRRVEEVLLLLDLTLDTELLIETAYTPGAPGGFAMARIVHGEVTAYIAGLAGPCPSPRLDDDPSVHLVEVHVAKTDIPEAVLVEWRKRQKTLRQRTRLQQANEK